MNNDQKIALLTAAGEAAYGPHWKSEFARYLSVNDRSVRQWANGERTVPDSVISELTPHLNARMALIRQAVMLLADAVSYNENYRSPDVITRNE